MVLLHNYTTVNSSGNMRHFVRGRFARVALCKVSFIGAGLSEPICRDRFVGADFPGSF